MIVLTSFFNIKFIVDWKNFGIKNFIWSLIYSHDNLLPQNFPDLCYSHI